MFTKGQADFGCFLIPLFYVLPLSVSVTHERYKIKISKAGVEQITEEMKREKNVKSSSG